jgi:two-component system, OmpR family, sensor histidine kinase MprB
MAALRYKRSLASRVTMLATFAVGFSVALVALSAYLTVRHQLQATMDQSLLRRATAAARASTLGELSRNKIPSWMVGAVDIKVGFITSHNQVYSADTGPEEDVVQLGKPELNVARGVRAYSCRTVSTAGGDYRVAAVPSNQSGVALVLSQSLESNNYTLDRLGLVLFIFGAVGVIAATLAGWGVARNGLRPVRRLTDAAEEIARTEKLNPIEVEGNDEIARLARSFNSMLAALSASRDRQRQLVADAGHELRTPLTSLRTNLDLLTQAETRGGLSEASRVEVMDDVRFQIEEMTTLIGDLTELAREESSGVELDRVDLAEITDRAVTRARRRASSLEFNVHTESWWVTGESQALERAVLNLLDNAAKWSPPLGVVTVRLEGGTLLVTDQGHGIADADLPHVFDRFYRSSVSRTMPGSGLGLAIVRQVAERHGGTVRAGHAANGGAALWFEVPGLPHAPDQNAVSETIDHV